MTGADESQRETPESESGLGSPGLLMFVTHPMTARILLRGQLRAFRQAGIRVGLVAGTGVGLDEVRHRERVAVFQIPMVRPPSPISDLRSLVWARKVIAEFKPTIVSAGTPKAGLVGMIAAATRATPVRVYTLRGLVVETATGVSRLLMKASERWAGRCAHSVVCVSESLRRQVVALGLIPEEKLVLLGAGSSNGVDERRFHPPTAGERAEARATLNIPHDAPTIGFVGRLTIDKGILDLAEVFLGNILQQMPAAHLVLAGGFESGDSVPTRVRRLLTTHPGVRLVGITEQPEQVYRAIDVLAFPSYREGFPNAPLEAAATRIPVAGYGATGTIDAVVDGRTGTLSTVGDKTALAAAIIRYLNEPGLRESHGSAGRERVVAHFRSEDVWARWIDFYRALI